MSEKKITTMNGNDMYALCKELFPINRSLTGEGVRQTLAILKRENPELEIREVPCGTKVFDWTIPKEWNCTDGYIITPDGEKIADYKVSNLHVLGYSTPVDRDFTLEELKEHLYTLEDQPDVIPYVTSYYKERFGWAITHKQLKSLKEGTYHGVIKSSLTDGVLNYADCIIKGESSEEIFFSTYVCHPSMANNECSGPVLASALIKYVKSLKRRKYSYRFVFAPETIGAITYLATPVDCMQIPDPGKAFYAGGNIFSTVRYMQRYVKAGFNLSCVGDDRDYSIIHSRYGDTLADRVLTNILNSHTGGKFSDYSYLRRGSDERQYQAPGIDIPLVGFCRSKYHDFPEYHTSADNMDLVSPEGFQGSYDVMAACIRALEGNGKYVLTCFCEPQLGKRGLVPTISSKETYQQTLHLKDLIAYSDGRNDLMGISEIIGAPMDEVIDLADKLIKAGLLEKYDERTDI